jgi:hypothetical protein
MDSLRNKILPSGLLSPQENQKVCNLLPDKVQSVSTAVVQFYIAQNTRWQYILTGVACLVKASTSYQFLSTYLGNFENKIKMLVMILRFYDLPYR